MSSGLKSAPVIVCTFQGRLQPVAQGLVGHRPERLAPDSHLLQQDAHELARAVYHKQLRPEGLVLADVPQDAEEKVVARVGHVPQQRAHLGASR